MNDLFNSVLNMSITGTVVIAAVIIVRLLLRKLPKKYAYMLWSVVGFRLCIPFSFKAFISIFQLNPIKEQTDYISDGHIMSYVPVADNSLDNLSGVVPPDAIISEVSDKITLTDVLPYIWVTVAVIMLIYAAVSYFILKKNLNTSVRYKDNIYQSERILSPFILGIFKPKIYIPFDINEEYLQYVIAHECCHIKRRDNVVKLFAYILLSVHWYNPFCWLAFYLMNKDMEMSCDERVIKDNPEIKKVYSFALLSFAVDNKIPSPASLCFGEGSVKGRIKNILSFKKPKTLISIFTVILCVTVLIVCAANPRERDKAISDVNTGNSYIAYAIGDFVAEQGTLSTVELGNKGFVYISDNDMVAYDSQLFSAKIPSYYRSGWQAKGNFSADEFKEYLENNVFMPVADNWSLPKFKTAAVIDYFDAYYSSTPSYSIYILDDVPYMIQYANRYFLLNYDEKENKKLSDENFVANLALLQDDTREYIDSLFDSIVYPDDELLNTSSNPGDYVSYNQSAYDELVNGNIYTLQYIFEEFERGRQTDLKGHIMRLVMDDIIGGEEIKLYAETGQEYFDAWSQHIIDIVQQNDEDFLKSNYPYGYFYYSLYGSSNVKYVKHDFEPFDIMNYRFIENKFADRIDIGGGVEIRCTTTIYAMIGGASYTLYEPDFDVSVCAFIDDMLFFRNIENNKLYRMTVMLGGNELYAGPPVLVCDIGYVRICKADENELVLYNGENDYYALNTKTGVFSKADYNRTVNYSDTVSNGVTVDQKQAIELAEKFAVRADYYNSLENGFSDNPEPMKKVLSCQLIEEIDYYRYVQKTDMSYFYDEGDVPFYGWLVELENDNYRATAVICADDSGMSGCTVSRKR